MHYSHREQLNRKDDDQIEGNSGNEVYYFDY